MSSTLLDIVSVDCFHNGLPKYFQHILSIFEQARSFSHVADFASLALQALASENRNEKDPERISMRTDLLSRLFYASLKTCQFDQAFSAMARYEDHALQRSALTSLITGILSASGPGLSGLQQILHFPTSLLPNIATHVDDTLVSLARKQTSFNSLLEAGTKWADTPPDYQRILQAYRVARNDYRGAAEIAYRNVQRLRHARDSPSNHLVLAKGRDTDDARQTVEEDDPESKEIRNELLSLINLLGCVDKSEAYILVEKEDPMSAVRRRSLSVQADDDGNVFMDDADSSSLTPNGTKRRLSSSTGAIKPLSRRDSKSSVSGAGVNNHRQRRVIVTLDHLRREYQFELDRVSRIERGDWEFGLLDAPEADADDTMLL